MSMGCRLPSPGGLALTERAVFLCSFKKGARVADIGCGDGHTVGFLREKFGLDALGIDCDSEIISKAAGNGCEWTACADSVSVPFGCECFDGVFFECSFSKMNEPSKVLEEAYRILKTNGKIVISDFYARGEEASLAGVLGRIEKKESIEKRLASAGFSFKYFEDRSDDLLALMGQLILNGGVSALYESLGASVSQFKKIKCGYAIFIASKGGM